MRGLRGGAKAALHLRRMRFLALGDRTRRGGALCLWVGPQALGAGFSAALKVRSYFRGG